jgi:hypothetical protein
VVCAQATTLSLFADLDHRHIVGGHHLHMDPESVAVTCSLIQRFITDPRVLARQSADATDKDVALPPSKL